jgi:hypothetical protein
LFAAIGLLSERGGSQDRHATEKYVLDRKETYPIPFLLAVPNEDGPHPGLLYLHPEGKTMRSATAST